jgi:putative NADH-flavin reductase
MERSDTLDPERSMISKRVLVLGATGGTGRQVVTQALERGHTVTALVRDASRITIASDRLRVLEGSVTDDGGALAAAMRGQDAVISSLGVGNSFQSRGLIAASAPRIVRAMQEEGVRRLIFTSAFGVGETRRDVPLLPRLFMGLLLRDVYRDKEAGEAPLVESGLDWTLVYPTGLADGTATGRWRAGERLALRGFPHIDRADAAAFLVAQIDDTTYLRKRVLVSS